MVTHTRLVSLIATVCLLLSSCVLALVEPRQVTAQTDYVMEMPASLESNDWYQADLFVEAGTMIEVSSDVNDTWCWGGPPNDCSNASGTPGRPGSPEELPVLFDGGQFGIWSTLVHHERPSRFIFR